MHLLKWEYQPAKRGRSWAATIREQRRRIAKPLRRMPSLRPKLVRPKLVRPKLVRPKLDQFLADNDDDAREMAVAETGLDPSTFPPSCPDETAQILDVDWLPTP